MAQRRNFRVPSYTLSNAIDSARILMDKYGMSEAGADDVAVTLGYKNRASGAAATRLGTLSHYGLIDVCGTAKYRISHIACMILRPRKGEKERAEGLVLAAKSPKLFQALIERFDGKGLPSSLSNILLVDFNVPNSKINDVVNIFRENLHYAGMLKNGLVIANPVPAPQEFSADTESDYLDAEQITEKPADISEPEVNNIQQVKQAFSRSRSEHSLQILFTDGREACLLLPDRANQEDLEEVVEYIEFLINRMKRNKKPLAPSPAADD